MHTRNSSLGVPGLGCGMVQGRSYSVKQDKMLKLPSRYTTVELDEGDLAAARCLTFGCSCDHQISMHCAACLTLGASILDV